MLNSYEQKLCDLLQYRKHYSSKKIQSKMQIDCEKLAQIAGTLSQKLGDKIHYFLHNNVVYIKFGSRLFDANQIYEERIFVYGYFH